MLGVAGQRGDAVWGVRTGCEGTVARHEVEARTSENRLGLLHGYAGLDLRGREVHVTQHPKEFSVCLHDRCREG